MKPPPKRPELLLAAAALLVAAAVLLVAGAKSALVSPETTQPGAAPRINPFAAGQPVAQAEPGMPDSTGVAGSYVVGYTGIVVIPPGGGEAPLQPYDGETAPPQISQAAQPPQQALPQQPAAPPQAVYPVNLNTATQAQLETLPGIGPVKAQAILAWRAANGGFTNANQLLQVKGIGQKTLENMLPYITW